MVGLDLTNLGFYRPYQGNQKDVGNFDSEWQRVYGQNRPHILIAHAFLDIESISHICDPKVLISRYDDISTITRIQVEFGSQEEKAQGLKGILGLTKKVQLGGLSEIEKRLGVMEIIGKSGIELSEKYKGNTICYDIPVGYTVKKSPYEELRKILFDRVIISGVEDEFFDKLYSACFPESISV